jgi:hypothetical protein
MAAWGLIPALTGFQWSALDGRMEFAAAGERASWFWATGQAWGTVVQEPVDGGVKVELCMMGGRLPIRSLVIAGRGEIAIDGIATGDVVRLRFSN